MVEYTYEVNIAKEYIEKRLISCKKDGMLSLLHHMQLNGFYSAPCSSKYHLAVPGGLAIHTKNVMQIAEKIFYAGFSNDVDLHELYLVCALHDLGKMGQFGKPNYKEHILDDGTRDSERPFMINESLQYVPHECRSIIIASKFINLNENEQNAILYHNGLYGDFRNCVKGEETPLYLILHFADMWASRVEERNEF